MRFELYSLRNTFLPFVFLMILGTIPAKAQYVDSLKNLLEVYEADTNRVRVLNLLSDAIYTTQPEAAEQYLDEGLTLSRQLDDIDGEAWCYYTLAFVYYVQNRHNEAIEMGKKSANMYRHFKDPVSEAISLENIGNNYFVTGRLDSANTYYQYAWDVSSKNNLRHGKASSAKCLGDILESRGKYDEALDQYKLSAKLAKEVGDKYSEAVTLNAIGIIYDYTGQIDSALVKYFQVLKMAEEMKDLHLEGTASNNIGFLYRLSLNEDFEKSLEYSRKALRAFTKAKHKKGISSSYQDIAYTYRKMNQLDSASMYYEKAIELRKEIGDKRGLSFSYNSYGHVFMEQNNFRKARECFEEGLKYSEEIGLTRGISNSIRYLGKLNLELKNYRQAYVYLNKAKEMALELDNITDLENVYRRFVRYHEETGNYKEALANHKLLTSTLDTLFKKDQNKKIAEVEALYQNEKKEKQITQQKNDIYELEIANAEIAKQRNLLIGGSLFLGLLIFFGYRLNKIRKERNDKKAFAEALIFAQEEERKRIARDLHDGVGQSLLLIKKQLASNFEVTLENQQLISDTLQEVRSISQDLHPFQLEKFGLTAAINEIIRKVEKSTDLFITHEIDDINGLFSEKANINLYRTVQEAFNNIVKHSEATAVKVSIQKQEKMVTVRIQDNGKGFDHEVAIVTSKSLGLRTMFERISAIGGELKIENGSNSGTIVSIRIPLK